MINKSLAARFTKIILEAQGADREGLIVLRKKIMKAVDTFGAKRFVTVTAQVLKDNFRIEGCNDVRIPLKRIFDISLDELEEALDRKKYKLPMPHPVNLLSQDHKESIRKLKGLRVLQDIRGYFEELDAHIKKEEEVFFPVLEKNGMDEHPENLREEHKKFREILTGVIGSQGKPELLKEEFIPAICNHIFRETYIFYPAALEFINEKEWKDIGMEFQRREMRV